MKTIKILNRRRTNKSYTGTSEMRTYYKNLRQPCIRTDSKGNTKIIYPEYIPFEKRNSKN